MAVQRVSILLLLLILLPFFGFCLRARATYNGGGWDQAHATCYESGPTTMGGACGYYNVDTLGYGENTAALSYALFKEGYTCGACFEIKCYNDDKSCKQSSTITVTATNSCPANAPNTPPWCNVPNKHFDLAKSMFITIAEYTAGIVPVLYRRVPCKRDGGIKFTFIKKSIYLKLVLITNVGGAGDVQEVLVITNGSSKQLRKNWGQNWQLDGVDEGQELQFQVTTSDGKSVTSHVFSNWKFGETRDGEAQFP